MARLRLPASPVEESGAARVFIWAGFAVAVAAVAVYAQDYVVGPACVLVAAAGHLSSWRRRHSPRGLLRQLVVAGLVFASLAYFVADSVGAIFGGQVPQAHFAELLVAVTSFDLKTRRNLYSSLWISLAIVYLAAVYAWDYPFGLFVVLWALALAGFWAASHLRRLEAPLELPRRPVAIAALAALLAGVAAFLLLPQPSAQPAGPAVVSLPSFVSFHGEVENPALPLAQFAADPSGATGSVDLHYRGRPRDSVVMYVRTGAPAYWRGLVFDHYAKGSWTATQTATQRFPAYVEPRRLPQPIGPNLGTFLQVFRIVRPLPGLVYAANPIASVYYPAAELRQDAYGTFRAPEPLRAGQTYSVVSYLPNYTPAALRGAEGFDDQRATDRDPGALSERARQLARDAVAGAESDRYDQVMALTSYLQTHYRYSQQLGHVPPTEDPVDWFLFDAKIGYCEQFATAEVMMLRSLNIPARLATGYSTGEYDPNLDQSVVREGDAHAWVEVYFPERGWVPVDPSPGFSALAATQFPNRWSASGIARVIPHLTMGAGGAALGALGPLAAIPGVVALLLASVVGLAWLVSRLRTRRRSGEEDELLALYDRLQRRLGRRRAPPETPLEYRARAPGGSLDAVLGEVTTAVNQGAYGGRWPDRGRVAEWAERIS